MAHTPTRQLFRALGCAAAIALPALLASSVAVPVQAQISISIGFDNFRSRLAPYGTWSNHPRWGNVWHPTRVRNDFRPYYDGHWVNTREYGWMWVSDESWGDVPYHYGRWVRDPREGWLWVPGYVWGPSWVVWRSGGGNIGWFPMPPGDNYYGEGAYRDNFDSEYGYRDWYGPSFDNTQFLSLWIFVGESHFGDRNYRNYALPQRDYGRFIGQTRDSTNYTTVNNYVVNRSVDANRLQQVTSQRFEPVPARNVIRNAALVTPATTGRQVEQRERQQRPIPANSTIQGRGAAAGAGQPAPQLERNAPATSTPTANQAPQGLQRHGSERNPTAAGAGQPAPAAERNVPAASTPNVRQAPQGMQGRGNDRSPAAMGAGPAAPQPERNAPAPSTPNERQAPQGAQGRGNDRNPSAIGAGQAAPQVPRVAPAAVTQPTPAAPPTPANPPENRGGRDNSQPDRGAQAPQTRVAPEQSARGAAPGAQAPARVQGNAPTAAGQGNTRGNKQGDTKNTDDQKAPADRKNAGGRGQN